MKKLFLYAMPFMLMAGACKTTENAGHEHAHNDHHPDNTLAVNDNSSLFDDIENLTQIYSGKNFEACATSDHRQELDQAREEITSHFDQADYDQVINVLFKSNQYLTQLREDPYVDAYQKSQMLEHQYYMLAALLYISETYPENIKGLSDEFGQDDLNVAGEMLLHNGGSMPNSDALNKLYMN